MAFYPYLAYEASAGSGKTFALTLRYISLLFLGVSPNKILSLTFTNKAANEMKLKITSTLKELELRSRENELNELCKILDMEKEQIILQKKKVLKDFLQSDIKISTIDKFFASILRKFAFYKGLTPDFAIENYLLEQEKIELFLKRSLQKSLYDRFVKYAALEKKRVSDIMKVLDTLFERDFEIKQKSAKDKKEWMSEDTVKKGFYKLKQILQDCEKGLSSSGQKALEDGNLKEIATRTWICKDSLGEYNYFKKCYTPEADKYFKEFKNALRDYFKAKENHILKELFTLYGLYKEANEKVKKDHNELDFKDVTNFVYDLLSDEIKSDFFYFRLDSKIDHILIDEFQDTSIVQYRILEPLLEEISSGVGVKDLKSLFYVGDIKQSIYRFRGGAKELFQHASEQFRIKTMQLNVNYRSKENIVKFVNEVFRDRIKGYFDQEALGSNAGGYVEVLKSEDISGDAADKVFELLSKGAKKESIAILTYTNDDAVMVEEKLLEKDSSINITTEATEKLICASSVLAVIEFLKYLYFKEKLYKSNFLSIIGNSWDDELDIEDLNVDEELPLLIKKIIKKFDLYEKDENLLKLLEISFRYKDIEEFLFDLENLNEDQTKKESLGIKILTIHKSKGLEFEHLIVCDRLKKKGFGGGSLLFEYDGIDLANIHTKNSKRECFDDEYDGALKKEAKLVLEDELNAQYVAFTRAKNSLVICTKEKGSAFENLDLSPLKIGETIQIAHPSPLTPHHSPLTTYPSPSTPHPSPLTPHHSPLTTHPSPLTPLDYEPFCVGSQKENIKQKDEKEKEDIKAVTFGLALHYMLEIISDFDEKALEKAYWGMKNRYRMLLDEEECEDIRQRAQKLLKDDTFLELTKGKLYKEQPFFYNGEFRQIDLLVEKEEKMIVIDYKSSLKEREEYAKQVLNYKRAIQTIYKKDTEAFVCYIGKEEAKILNY